ncbi:SDR family oxidoreductase [Catenulispora sp. NF23]|uniref:SDR family NAD(P)-dependent oxidoreductase n=1 Tax=Catenulispora pinistramenti TaxID=2705254 RepID=UPI001BA4F787|nr:SDR family oxidoreductase [Catenulispora pinistramenti]MBS2537709.1 SDR family oxidoreductase [Catenulispora pinistramenti]
MNTTTKQTETAGPAGAWNGSNPVAVITGASQGLGLALARGLAERGWSLVIDARTPERLAAADYELSKLTTVVALAGDVTDEAHRADLTEAASNLGGASLLVNNASSLGASPMPTLAGFPLDALVETFAVNVVAPLALAQLLLPQLREHGGELVNISSDAAVEPYEGWGGYGASKAALDHASAILALEETTIRVWAVDPGDLQTQMHQDAFPGEDISGLPLPRTVVPAFLRLLDERRPSGRYQALDLVGSRRAAADAEVA